MRNFQNVYKICITNNYVFFQLIMFLIVYSLRIIKKNKVKFSNIN